MCSSLYSLCFALLDPQAGGGGSFGGGGGGGSNFGGDGDGLGFLLYYLIRLAIEAPLIGIPLLIVVAVVVLKGSRKGVSVHRRRVIRRASPGVQAQRHGKWSAEVRASDPDFDQEQFLARVRSAFGKIQDSWCAQDLTPVLAFLSDGVLERFSLQFEEQRQAGWRQGIESLKIGELGICDFAAGEHFDTLTVRIPFNADIHRLDLKQGKLLSGSKLPRNHFEECWSFVRRKGARSIASAGLIEGQCPSCGAPLKMNRFAQCGSCEAHVRSGEFDWILTEITQVTEWRSESVEHLPGLASFRASDPGLSVQLLEDQASVAFWRKCAADRTGQVEPLVRVSSDSFLEGYRFNLEALPGAEREYVAECAVGSVRCLGLLPGESKDRAVVEILSDGCRATVDAKGARRVETARHLQRVLYVFERQQGELTDLKQTFSTSHCRNCGAHDPGGNAPRCAYCDAPRTGEVGRWLLSEIMVEHTLDAKALRQELTQVSRPSPAPSNTTHPAQASADLVVWAAALVNADQRVDGRERLALQTLGERLGLSAARMEEMFEDLGDGSSVPVPRDTQEARSWMRALLRVALSDGTMSSIERRMLQHTASEFEISRAELDRMLRHEERSLYREARQV
jgi:uncharacterized tellurite resistance protein B-like protein